MLGLFLRNIVASHGIEILGHIELLHVQEGPKKNPWYFDLFRSETLPIRPYREKKRKIFCLNRLNELKKMRLHRKDCSFSKQMLNNIPNCVQDFMLWRVPPLLACIGRIYLIDAFVC